MPISSKIFKETFLKLPQNIYTIMHANQTMKLLRDNPRYVVPVGISVLLLAVVGLQKHFNSGPFLDITGNTTQVMLTNNHFLISFLIWVYISCVCDILRQHRKDRKFGQKETPPMNGIMLKILTRLLNSRFGQSFLGPLIVKEARFVRVQIKKQPLAACQHLVYHNA